LQLPTPNINNIYKQQLPDKVVGRVENASHILSIYK